MAEQDQNQEKTEEPTAKKLEKAREEGQVPRSRELVTALLLIGGIGSLALFAPAMAQRYEHLTLFTYAQEGSPWPNPP